MSARFLILSAGMGSGHDAVATELARELTAAGHDTVRADVLDLFPAGIGTGLRACYRTAIGRVPLLYGGVYAAFFRPGHGPRPGSAPLTALADDALLGLVERERPDVVVAAFHLAAQITGRLRAHGALRVPSAVVITDFAVHRQWLHPDNDLFLCLTRGITERVRRDVPQAQAAVCGPLVGARFRRRAGGAPGWRQRLGASSGGPVLVSAGAWGVGSGIAATARLVSAAGFLPVVLCGDNARMRHEIARVPGALAPGWVDDMPGLMTAARVLIDNAAGQTALEALAMGLPVVGYRPIAGHGAAGVRAMAAYGLSEHVRDSWSLLGCLDTLGPPGAVRDERIAAGRALFTGGAVPRLAALAAGAPVPVAGTPPGGRQT